MIASGYATDRKIFKIAQLNDDLKMLKSEFVEQRTVLMNLKMETKIIGDPLVLGQQKHLPLKS